jgi:hypothetical protein
MLSRYCLKTTLIVAGEGMGNGKDFRKQASNIYLQFYYSLIYNSISCNISYSKATMHIKAV